MTLVPRFRLPFRPRRAPGSWALVATVKGEPEAVLPFVAHHLQGGCEEIHLHLDGPDPRLAALLAPLARVRVTTCDDAYWAELGGRPGTVSQRQIANLAVMRRQLRSEWLIHIDSDEFLIAADGGPAAPGPELAAELARLEPGRIDWARIPHCERVLRQGQPQIGLCDGLFRDQVRDPALARRIYGQDLAFLNRGFSGHVRGKIALRVRAPLLAAVHQAAWPDQPFRRTIPDAELPPFAVLSSTRMLHFDGWTARHWVSKLQARASGGHPGRVRQVAHMREAATEAERLALFERLQCIGPEREQALRAAGLLHDIGFDPAPAIAAVFPGLDLSLSAAEFDRRRTATAAPHG